MARHALFGTVGDEARRLQATEPADVGADPEVALPIFGHVVDTDVGQPFFYGIGRQSIAGEPRQAALGADPEIAGLVFGEVIDEGAGQALGGPVGPHLAQLQPEQAVAGADPERAVLGGVNGADLVGQRAGTLQHRRDVAVADAQQPALPRADPHVALAIGVDHSHVPVRQAVALGERRELSGLGADQAFGRGQPQGAVAVLADRYHQVARQAVGGRVGDELPGAIAGQPAVFAADPEGAVAGFVQRENAIALQARGVAGIEDREGHAVESRQATERPQPQVAVAGLDDGVDRALGQALLGAPDVVHVGTDEGLAGARVGGFSDARPNRGERQRDGEDDAEPSQGIVVHQESLPCCARRANE